MNNFKITLHALERIFERLIRPDDCLRVFESGVIIEEYPGDKPFPSRLIGAEIEGRFIHIVVSQDNGTVYLITAYEPDGEQWDHTFMKRRK